jgi:hypothetical protein
MGYKQRKVNNLDTFISCLGSSQAKPVQTATWFTEYLLPNNPLDICIQLKKAYIETYDMKFYLQKLITILNEESSIKFLIYILISLTHIHPGNKTIKWLYMYRALTMLSFGIAEYIFSTLCSLTTGIRKHCILLWSSPLKLEDAEEN